MQILLTHTDVLRLAQTPDDNATDTEKALAKKAANYWHRLKAANIELSEARAALNGIVGNIINYDLRAASGRELTMRYLNDRYQTVTHTAAHTGKDVYDFKDFNKIEFMAAEMERLFKLGKAAENKEKAEESET